MNSKSARTVVAVIVVLAAFGAGAAVGHRTTFATWNRSLAWETQFNLAQRVDTLARLRTDDTAGAVTGLEHSVDTATLNLAQKRPWAELDPDVRVALQLAKAYRTRYPAAIPNPELNTLLGTIPMPDAQYCSPALRKLLATEASAPTAATDALQGSWVLNLAKSRYGNGAEPRSSETFDCDSGEPHVSCVLRSTRQDGRTLEARFAAAYDGTPQTVSGILDVDTVTLSKVDESTADATFALRGKPVFGYRAVKSADQRSLTIVSVDPVTRAMLTSVIVYDRR